MASTTTSSNGSASSGCSSSGGTSGSASSVAAAVVSSSYAKALLRSKNNNCENEQSIMNSHQNHHHHHNNHHHHHNNHHNNHHHHHHRGSYSSNNGHSRGTSSIGDSDGHEDTSDWPELNYKQKFVAAPPPKENPWRVNPNAAALIAMKLTPSSSSSSVSTATLSPSSSTSSTTSSSSSSTTTMSTTTTVSSNIVSVIPTSPSSASSTASSMSDNEPTKPTSSCPNNSQVQDSVSSPKSTASSSHISSNSSASSTSSSLSSASSMSSTTSDGPHKLLTPSSEELRSLQEKGQGLGRLAHSAGHHHHPVNKVKYAPSPIKSSSAASTQIKHGSSGDTGGHPIRNGHGGRGRGGRGGLSNGRGRGNYRGKNNYYHHNNQNYYAAAAAAAAAVAAGDAAGVTEAGLSSPVPGGVVREDYKDFPADFTTLTPMYAGDYIMPYLTPFPPTAFAPPLETAGIITLTEEQPFPPFVTVDAMTVEMVKNQIEYYFSEENLEKDFFLRRKMDSEGYLPVQLIASFHRVKSMTEDYNVVVASIQSSDKLEITEDLSFVRTLNNPTKWPILDSVVSLSISLTAMKIAPMLPSPASSSTADAAELDGIISPSTTTVVSVNDSIIPSPASNGLTALQAPMVTANGGGGVIGGSAVEMFNPNVPEFVPKSKGMN